MAEKRRLQQEVDRTLKRVDEGCDLFFDLHEKLRMQQSPKIENELKREIKKLQKLRDQIKSWQTHADIKEKGPLDEARRRIERGMEIFKQCERESKVKAFSREGLASRQRQAPEERLRERVVELLQQLQREAETAETEIEALACKKGRKDRDREKKRLQLQLENHRWHMGKLELGLRLLDNEGIDLRSTAAMCESVSEYLTNCSNPDYVFDASIYDCLSPDSDEANTGQDTRERASETATNPAGDGAAASPPCWSAILQQQGPGQGSAAAVWGRKDQATASPAASSSSNTSSTGSKAADGTPVGSVWKTGRLHVAADQQHQQQQQQGTVSPPSGDRQQQQQQQQQQQRGGTGTANSTPWKSKAAAAVAASSPAATTPPAAAAAGAAAAASAAAAGASPAGKTQAKQQGQQRPAADSSSSSSSSSSKRASTGAVTPQGSPTAAGGAAAAAGRGPADYATAAVAADALAAAAVAAAAFAAVAAVALDGGVCGSLAPAAAVAAAGIVLAAAAATDMPVDGLGVVYCLLWPQWLLRLAKTDPSPSSPFFWPPWIPRGDTGSSPFLHVRASWGAFRVPGNNNEQQQPARGPGAPDCFPKGRLAAAEERQFYKRLDELKAHAWRFHKKYLTWFQRHEEPRVSTDKFEEGTYVYFDYDNGNVVPLLPFFDAAAVAGAAAVAAAAAVAVAASDAGGGQALSGMSGHQQQKCSDEALGAVVPAQMMKLPFPPTAVDVLLMMLLLPLLLQVASAALALAAAAGALVAATVAAAPAIGVAAATIAAAAAAAAAFRYSRGLNIYGAKLNDLVDLFSPLPPYRCVRSLSTQRLAVVFLFL
ncbi:hypothetical protein ACSSS7_001495 [Eimeria intestinalis]